MPRWGNTGHENAVGSLPWSALAGRRELVHEPVERKLAGGCPGAPRVAVPAGMSTWENVVGTRPRVDHIARRRA